MGVQTMYSNLILNAGLRLRIIAYTPNKEDLDQAFWSQLESKKMEFNQRNCHAYHQTHRRRVRGIFCAALSTRPQPAAFCTAGFV